MKGTSLNPARSLSSVSSYGDSAIARDLSLIAPRSRSPPKGVGVLETLNPKPVLFPGRPWNTYL